MTPAFSNTPDYEDALTLQYRLRFADSMLHSVMSRKFAAKPSKIDCDVIGVKTTSVPRPTNYAEQRKVENNLRSFHYRSSTLQGSDEHTRDTTTPVCSVWYVALLSKDTQR